MPAASTLALARAVVARGARLAGADAPYLEWISPNDGGRWLGFSHGSAGVLFALLRYCPAILDDGAATRARVVATVDRIVAAQFASGNFPAEYYNSTDDVLVQWDHGAPGVATALAVAARALGNSSYLDAARRAMDCTWERGLLTKGLMNCHGIGGTTYAQLFVHKATGDDRYLFRALQFQRFVARTPELYDPEQGMRVVTPNPYAFWTGSFESAATYWADFVAFAREPARASMPLFETAI